MAGGSHLVFEADLNSIPEEKRDTAIKGVKDVIERRVNLFGVSEPNVQSSSYAGKERVIVELPGIKDTAKAVSLIGTTAQLIFAELSDEEENGGLIPTNLTGADLQSADVVFDQTTGKPAVSIKFTKEGGIKFEEITGRNINKQLPIILDGEVVSAPVVQDKISGGDAQITGNFTTEEAKTLTIQLNAGALPVPVTLVEETHGWSNTWGRIGSKKYTCGICRTWNGSCFYDSFVWENGFFCRYCSGNFWNSYTGSL